MSDNLAHRLENRDFSKVNPAMNNGGDFPITKPITKPEIIKPIQKTNESPSTRKIDKIPDKIIGLSNKRLKTEEQPKTNEQNNIPKSINGQINKARQTANKAKLEGIPESIDDVASIGTREATKNFLTVLWGSVWLDFTLLSLLGLNLFLIKTIFLPNNKYVCNLGDDYLIGKWIPGKLLARYTEIIILMTINFIILAIITLFIYIIYKVVTNPFETVWQLL